MANGVKLTEFLENPFEKGKKLDLKKEGAVKGRVGCGELGR